MLSVQEQKKKSERFYFISTTHFYYPYETLNFSPISMSEVEGLSLYLLMWIVLNSLLSSLPLLGTCYLQVLTFQEFL
jgi:hypothetical protein